MSQRSQRLLEPPVFDGVTASMAFSSVSHLVFEYETQANLRCIDFV